MYTFEVTTLVQAPPTRCFDLNRSVDAHLASTHQTGERVVAGRSTGLFELGDEVTWEARHLHLRRRLTIRITTSNRPTFSQEQMIHGPFRSFEHDHIFDPIAGHATRITDVIRFAAPFGPIGWLAERLIVGPHLKRFITTRALALKQLAESEGWRAFVSDSNQSS